MPMPDPQRRRSARYIAGFCALLIAAGWAGLHRISRVYRDEEVARVQSENAFIAYAFEEHARRILKTADTALRFLEREFETHGEVTAAMRDVGAMTKEDLQAVQVAIADERGELVYSAVPLKAPINISAREHFLAQQRAKDAGLFVGRPVLAKATNTWTFFLSRRLDRPDGSFAGVVSLGLDPFYFGRVYGSAGILHDRAGLLVGTDHIVRVRISAGEEFVGDDISGFSPVFREAAQRPTGHYEVVTAVAARARFASYRAMPDYPLIVIVSAVQDEALAAWRSRVRDNVLLMAALTVFIALFGVFLARSQAQTRRREAEAAVLQERLLQSQKLEAIGTLAGGVAHDFNNMLGVILGQVEFALEDAGPSSPLRESLEEISKAAHRSANVTRQLLAFARKQAIAPRIIDLNAGVEPVLGMLRRLLGERIDLRWLPGERLWKVRIDPSQVDQLLTNLAANARDAIAADGTVTFETRNATIDAAACAGHPGATPGDYVVLSVSDTGAGIVRETLGSIFEPFFTTKEPGKGTGLGLATVDGIVRQNGGFIDVASEPGKGTIFRVHLPRVDGQGQVDGADRAAPQEPRGGSETILVVEDERSNLALVTRMLSSMGYRVLATHAPADAIRMAGEEAGAIDLLVTDVVMPGMDGKELCEVLRSARPGLRCLFMSGYPANVIVHQGVLDEGLDYIQKPFTRTAFAEAIRKVLDGRHEGRKA